MLTRHFLNGEPPVHRGRQPEPASIGGEVAWMRWSGATLSSSTVSRPNIKGALRATQGTLKRTEIPTSAHGQHAACFMLITLTSVTVNLSVGLRGTWRGILEYFILLPPTCSFVLTQRGAPFLYFFSFPPLSFLFSSPCYLRGDTKDILSRVK